MGVPALTKDSRLIVGDETWVSDLTPHYLGMSITDTLTATGDPSEGRFWNEQDIATYERQISVDTLYFSEATNRLIDRYTGIVIASTGSEWDGGPTNWVDFASNAPVDAVLTNDVTFMTRTPWAAGLVSVPFKFTQNNTTLNISGDVTNEDICYVALTTKEVPNNRVFTLTVSSNTVTQTFSTTGIKTVDLNGLGAGTLNPVLSVASLADGQELSGLIVFGRTIVLADGRE